MYSNYLYVDCREFFVCLKKLSVLGCERPVNRTGVPQTDRPNQTKDTLTMTATAPSKVEQNGASFSSLFSVLCVVFSPALLGPTLLA